MKKEITTSITIMAKREKVWNILTDYKAYPEWNPFISSLTGNVAVGNIIKIQLQGFTFSPKVLTYTENTELSWLGHLGIKGLFDGMHIFSLQEQTDGTTLFKQSEHFRGLLVPLFSKRLDTDTKKGFEQMNQALKERAEQLH